MIPSTTMVAVGDTLTVTVTTENNSIGCDFPSYAVKLTSQVGWGTKPVNYEHLSPPIVEQQGNSTSTFTLVMMESGYITYLGALISGEHNCNGTWEQVSIPSEAHQIQVFPDPETLSLALFSNCLFVPEGGFRTIWTMESGLQRQLGCPAMSGHPRALPVAFETDTKYQPFQSGQMVWFDRPTSWLAVPHMVLVLKATGMYQSYPDDFDPTRDPINDDETLPKGFREPSHSLGKIWREQPGVRSSLGWATADEVVGSGIIQEFSGGRMIWISQTNRIYVLTYDDNSIRVFDISYSNGN